MNIYITGLSSGYEVEHLVRLFYPMAPLTLTQPEEGTDCVWAEKRPDSLWAMVPVSYTHLTLPTKLEV